MHILLAVCIFGLASSDLIVNTNTGPIKGITSTVHNVDAFLGIPYAEPPVGDLRFAKPVAKKQWTEIYDATKLPPACPQPDLGPYIFMADVSNLSEDCLYINIWASKPNAMQNLKPVIIFIHGGAFISGSSNIKAYDGSYLARRGNIVVASISYRLGALGFFLVNTTKSNGNMGMFDQIMAIKWIKNNAKQFGGDPENLILMGSSAGAYSATAHMVSPLSKNLFKRVILHSGSIINPMFLDNNERLFKNSQAVASMLGCTNKTTSLQNDPEAVVQCLKTKPQEDFALAEKTLLMSNPGVFYPATNDEFLPKSSVDLFREGKFIKDVDVMIGVTEDEGSLFLFSAMHDYFGYFGENEDNIISKLRALGLSRRLLASLGQNNSSEIIDYYLKNTKHRIAVEYKKMVANIFGDFQITCNAIFAADFISLKGNQVYFYKFGFRPVTTPMAQWTGAMHTDELQYIFMKPFYGNFTDEEIELSHNLIDRWSAFAKKGYVLCVTNFHIHYLNNNL